MKNVLVVACLALGAGVLLACDGEGPTVGEVAQSVSSDGTPQWQNNTLVSSGIQRRYVVLAPVVNGNPKLPLLISMHGWGWTPELHVAVLGWAESFVTANNVIVAFPEGIGSSWNAGACCPPASNLQIDDVQFISELIDDVAASHRLDRARVYASGLSNGGAMAYRMACERPDLIAAVGSVSGNLRAECAPGRPVPIIEIHGEGDPLQPYYGGLDMFGNPVPSMAETMGLWADNNSCLPGAEKKTTFSGTDVTCEQFRACKDNSIVELCTVHGPDGIGGSGGGHNWPGAATDLYQTNPTLYFWWGYQTNEIAAHEVIWNFVKRYRRPPAVE